MSAQAHSNALILASPLVAGPVSLASADPTIEHPVYPEEIAAVSNAVPKRLSEFTAGRVAARLALKQLGAPAMSVPMAPDRSPIWPPGLMGSITHTNSACLAAAAWENEVRMLGLDVEEDEALEEALYPVICSPTEQRWLQGQPNPGQMAKLIFSAKEAAYKAQYRLSQTLFDFDTFETEFDLENGQFSAIFQRDVSPFTVGSTLCGRFAIGHGFIATAVVVLA